MSTEAISPLDRITPGLRANSLATRQMAAIAYHRLCVQEEAGRDITKMTITDREKFRQILKERTGFTNDSYEFVRDTRGAWELLTSHIADFAKFAGRARIAGETESEAQHKSAIEELMGIALVVVESVPPEHAGELFSDIITIADQTGYTINLSLQRTAEAPIS